MRGRAATAWFQAPWELIERTLSPDLWPERQARVRSRLRFYDLEFESSGGEPGSSAPRGGRFREAVVAVPARAGGFDGEVSLFMWSESDVYLMWAREAFGWPVRLADVELSGSFWSASEVAATSGECRAVADAGSVSLLDLSVSRDRAAATPSGYWLTPRRLVQPGDADDERRELLVVRPVIAAEGSQLAASGRVVFDFPSSHLLGGLGELEAEVDVADGFELLVGKDVTSLLSPSVR